jgi:tetratricopeptide (TPR) repeat protein
MDNLDYIDNYFTHEPDADRTREFEQRIMSDPAFAEEVAFFLSVWETSREASQIVKKNHFKVIYEKKRTTVPAPVRKLVYYIAAAAAVAGIIFGIYTFTNSGSPQQLAGQYEKDQLNKLGVTMSGRSNSLQTGLRLYNEGKPAEALVQFEILIQSDTANFTAREYAGIAALRMKEYNKALSYFEQLEIYNGLYANPALILQAVTLMERNQPGDAAKAKQLLQKIVANDLEGKEYAQEWLKKM